MINELDRVVLTEPVPSESLEKGDVGTVVHVYDDGKAYEICPRHTVKGSPICSPPCSTSSL